MKIQFVLITILSLCMACENKTEVPTEPKKEEKKKPLESYLLKGNEYLLKSEFQKADIQFDSLLKLDSSNISALYGMGVSSEMRGNHQAAIEYYSRAISIDPQFALAYYERANSKKVLGDNKAAIQDLKKSIELKPDFAVAIVELAHLEAKPGKTDQAIVDLLTQSINRKADSEILYQFRGNYNYYLGKKKAALEDFNQVLKVNPKNTESLYHSGVIYGELKDYPKAIENLTKTIALDNAYPMAYVYRGIYYYNQEENEKACADFQKAKELGESSGEQYASEYCSK